ncbi:MAG TPA: MFS transporter [archaeon]|nr:MFS transporter [archaeon]
MPNRFNIRDWCSYRDLNLAWVMFEIRRTRFYTRRPDAGAKTSEVLSQVLGVPEKRLNYGLSSTLFLMVMTIGYAVYAADRTVLASVLALMVPALRLTNYEIGLIGSAQYIGVLCFVFLSGHLSDRYGRKNVIILGIAVFTVFTWLIGFASNFLEAFVFRLISGFGEGIFWPVAMAAVASYFKNRKGLALGIFYVGFDAGSVAGLSLGGLAYSLSGDWRTAFFVAPSLGLLVIGGSARLKNEFQSSIGDAGRIRLGRDAFDLLKQRSVIVMMAFALVATWASVWQVVFLPYYFFKVLHIGILSSALFSAVVAVSGGVGKLILGGASDVWRRNRMLAVIALMVVLSYILFFATSSPILTLSVAIIMGFFSSSIFPIMQALMADICKGKTGTALGLTTSSQSVATVVSPIITASLFTIGVGKAVALNAMIPAALTLLLTLLLKDPRRSTNHAA